MAGSTDNPRIWLGADAFVAPVGTTAPTDVTTALDAAFKALGLLSEDGMTESRESDSTDHFAWGGTLVRTTRSKHKRSMTITALEDNSAVFGLVNPGSTRTVSAGPAPPAGTSTAVVKTPAKDERAFVLELKDGAITKRRAIPRAEVTEIADITLSDSELTAYELTITIYPAADGTLYRDITNDAQATAAP